jgi:hypothetical protein
LFAAELLEMIMTTKKMIVTVALLLGTTAAAMAQSAYTTGTAASNAAAGYPSPYGGYSGLYAYAPGSVSGHAIERREGRERTEFGR